MPSEKQNFAKYACETLAGLSHRHGMAYRVGVDGLFTSHVSRRIVSRGFRLQQTLPPSTSSPIIKHAAVWMRLFWEDLAVAPAMVDDVIEERKVAAELCAKLGRGRDKCLTTWLILPNMDRQRLHNRMLSITVSSGRKVIGNEQTCP